MLNARHFINFTVLIFTALHILGAVSCEKAKLETGNYLLTVDSSKYLFQNIEFESPNIPPKELEMTNYTDNLLEFDYLGNDNYLMISNDNKVQGIWVFEDTVPNTTSLLGYELDGLIQKKNYKRLIQGNINYKALHFDGTIYYPVEVRGKFLLSRQ
ncbi:MAG: hypothetical protein IPM77_03050 [Crocinitomicaceae bacterium]|nr:hypothetical protein [Crocinitomicaceae bacterium]